ncbi:MAG: NAD(P)H-dependent oxidoreductase subunit E [Acetobacteraceae bacterium]|nr:NAD(P)H-dependent oxidoreductase subunit E [Acetobacteraceae bacterium]
MNRYPVWNIEAARAVIRAEGDTPDAVLPMLHALQAHFGYIHRDATALVAEAVNLSRAEIHGTISFYHDFRSTPPAARVIRLCRAEACQAVGCEALVTEAARLGVPVDGPAADDVAIESVYCLGNCALGPSALVDGALVGRLDAARLAVLVGGGAVAEVQMP